MVRVVRSWHLVATSLIALAAISCVVVLSLLHWYCVDVLCVERTGLRRTWAARLRSLLSLSNAVESR